MAEPPDNPERADETGGQSERASAAGTPRWVKVFVIVAVAVAVLFVVLLIAGGHNPGRHGARPAETAGQPTEL